MNQTPPSGRAPFSLEEYERTLPVCSVMHEGHRIVYATPSQMTKWRVDSFFVKEPDTIAWIAGFHPSDVLVDIGANVGMYSVWAARTRGVRVHAFEPEAHNYALLNRNIQLNGLSSQVKAYCAGLSDRSGFGDLHLSNLIVGGSCHSLSEPLDFQHVPMTPVFSQGCIHFSLDDLLDRQLITKPTHIKIDIDGFEPKVIEGAARTLREPSVRSLLIEVNQNLPDHQDMVTKLVGLGFSYDPAQVGRAVRKEGTFKGCAEYVFKR